MFRHHRIVQPHPPDRGQAQGRAVEVDAEVEPQQVQFQPFLEPDAEAEQLIANGSAVAAGGPVSAPEAPAPEPEGETTDAAPEGEKAVAVPAKKAPRARKAKG